MKRYLFKLDKYQVRRLASSIRTKKDIIVLWMNAIKIASVYIEPSPAEVVGVMVFFVDKMSRVFLDLTGKIHSINFPFFIQRIDDALVFSSYSRKEIDSRVSSEILSLVENDNIFDDEHVLDFADPISEGIWSLLRDLMLYEDGYIRYDFDPQNQNGDMHPLHHLDVFYSPSTTFKVGLATGIDQDILADILNINTSCHFLRST